MAHRKREYEANGHEVVIQQVNEGGDISAWIDGYAANIDSAIDDIVDNLSNEILPLSIQSKIADLRAADEEWKAIETALTWMCDCHVYYCKKCGSFYDHANVVRTGFAGHKCKSCDSDDRYCPENPNGDSHEDECLNPSQKRNARVPTKYRCVHCSRIRQTTPTG